ncbi:MAG: class I SAM-dependent RNA methyltransferase [Sulfuritalea sp.]|nr:class I SAM-dependent RNA methyltransferase [Sulfuritalea sp.]
MNDDNIGIDRHRDFALNHYFVTCPRGLEPLLAEDLTGAGGQEISVVPGGAGCNGSLETGYRINLESRIATRVLWRIAQGGYRNEADVYRLAYDVDWTRLFSVDRSIRVYVTAIRSPLKSLEFITLKVKDAVCDRFRAETGRRPSVNTRNPEVRIHLFITEQQATLYLDTSGEPLYLRGHKLAKVGAPLKENLAAGILRLSGWQPHATPAQPLLDPMCGSGTFLLEAAQICLDDAPGLSREAGDFGFEHLKSFDAGLWRTLQREAAARRREATALPIFGSDNSADAVARTRQNLAHAGLDGLVTLETSDLLKRSAPAPAGVLVANPPYGERLGSEEELAAFYPLLGDALKQRFAGWNCWFLSADTRLPKLIRLQTSRRIPLYNGALECRLYNIEIVAGSRRDK